MDGLIIETVPVDASRKKDQPPVHRPVDSVDIATHLKLVRHRHVESDAGGTKPFTACHPIGPVIPELRGSIVTGEFSSDSENEPQLFVRAVHFSILSDPFPQTSLLVEVWSCLPVRRRLVPGVFLGLQDEDPLRGDREESLTDNRPRSGTAEIIQLPCSGKDLFVLWQRCLRYPFPNPTGPPR
jgi:hypothetical protein